MIQDISNSSVRNTSVSKSQTSAKAVKASSSTPPVIPRAVAATGLPSDKFSASIVSFARFFSLPLKPALLADIRRQALSPQPQQNTTQQGTSANAANLSAANAPASGESSSALKSFTDVKTREAFTLAAAAAESKGVELNQKGLESYAEAVDPDKRRQNDEDRQRDKRDKNQNEEENIISAESLKKMALQNSEDNPLLEILNKLPGKNGQRWIVLPFDFCEEDREYKISMRILLNNDEKNLNSAAFMALDISSEKREQVAGNSEQETTSKKRRQLFIMESSGEKLVRITICVWQELLSKDQNQLKKEISKIFDIPIERVNIRTSEESFPFEAEFSEPLASINEAV